MQNQSFEEALNSGDHKNKSRTAAMKKKAKSTKLKSVTRNRQKLEALEVSGISRKGENVPSKQTAEGSGAAAANTKGKSTLPKPVAADTNTKGKSTLPKPVAADTNTKGKSTLPKPVAADTNTKGKRTLPKPVAADTNTKGKSTLPKPVAADTDTKGKSTLPKPVAADTDTKGKRTKLKPVAEMRPMAEVPEGSGKSRRQKNDQNEESDSPPRKKQKRKTKATPKGGQQPSSTNQKNPRSAASEKWPVLSQGTKEYLNAVLELSVLSVLNQKFPKKDDVQMHLNRLKRRFLTRCEDMKAPKGVLANVKSLSGLYSEEAQKLTANEARLQSIQEEIDKTVETLERISEEGESLEEKIRLLSYQLEEAETEQVHLRRDPGVLRLPDLPKSSLEGPTLQEKLLKIPNSYAILQDLVEIQKSKDMHNMLMFLERAYEEVDQL